MRQAVFGQHDRHCAEGVGFHNIGPGVQVASVDGLDDIGPGDDQVFVAALVLGPPEVVWSQVE